MRCAKLESTLADVDEGLVMLRGKTQRLGKVVEAAEFSLSAEQLMQAREARQIELINGRKDGLYGSPRWVQGHDDDTEPATKGTKMMLDERVSQLAPPPPPPPVQKAGSMLTRIEDDWLSNLAL